MYSSQSHPAFSNSTEREKKKKKEQTGEKGRMEKNEKEKREKNTKAPAYNVTEKAGYQTLLFSLFAKMKAHR